MQLTPIRNKLLLRPSISDGSGLIVIPESQRFSDGMALVLDRGSKVITHIRKGDVVLLTSGQEKKDPINNKGDFFVNDSNVIGVIHRGKIFPFGNTIVFERDRGYKEYGSSKIITSVNERQSLFGWVRGHGLPLPGDRRKLGIKINSYCRLAQWEPHMQEFWHNNKFHLIVKESDLLYTTDEPHSDR